MSTEASALLPRPQDGVALGPPEDSATSEASWIESSQASRPCRGLSGRQSPRPGGSPGPRGAPAPGLTLSLPGQAQIQIGGQRRCWKQEQRSRGKREGEAGVQKAETRDTSENPPRDLPEEREQCPRPLLLRCSPCEAAPYPAPRAVGRLCGPHTSQQGCGAVQAALTFCRAVFSEIVGRFQG